MSNKVTNPPAKILLANSTSMSLNDRFSKLPPPIKRSAPSLSSSSTISQKSTSGMNRKGPKIIRKAPEVPANSLKAKLANDRRASARNRRLALQMANRPSVQAALKIKKKSIRQRLGGVTNNQANASNAKRTTTTGGGSGGNTRRPLNLRSRLGPRTRGAQLANRNLRARLGTGAPLSIKRRLGPLKPQQQQQLKPKSPVKRLSNNNGNTNTTVGNRLGRRNISRGRLSNGRGRASQNTSLNQSTTSDRSNNGNFQRRRGNNRRGGFNNQRRNNKRQNVNNKSQDALNKDLDTHMQKTRANLDADLDTYMKQAQ